MSDDLVRTLKSATECESGECYSEAVICTRAVANMDSLVPSKSKDRMSGDIPKAWRQYSQERNCGQATERCALNQRRRNVVDFRCAQRV